MPRPADEPQAAPDPTAPPKRNRGILGWGLLLCIVAAVVAAYFLGVLDRIGLLS